MNWPLSRLLPLYAGRAKSKNRVFNSLGLGSLHILGLSRVALKTNSERNIFKSIIGGLLQKQYCRQLGFLPVVSSKIWDILRIQKADGFQKQKVGYPK